MEDIRGPIINEMDFIIIVGSIASDEAPTKHLRTWKQLLKQVTKSNFIFLIQASINRGHVQSVHYSVQQHGGSVAWTKKRNFPPFHIDKSSADHIHYFRC